MIAGSGISIGEVGIKFQAHQESALAQEVYTTHTAGMSIEAVNAITEGVAVGHHANQEVQVNGELAAAAVGHLEHQEAQDTIGAATRAANPGVRVLKYLKRRLHVLRQN